MFELNEQQKDVARIYPFRATSYYLSLAESDSPEDPILRQCLPDIRELDADGFSSDPFGETGAAAFYPGVKRRFKDRILVMVSTVCALNCRHCTRKNLLAEQIEINLPGILENVRRHPEIREVLLSGGDPLMLPDEEILRYVEAFAALDQIDAVRIGTRVPVVNPERITPELAKALGRTKKVWVNVQFNHPREITEASTRACGYFVDSGIPVSNQSVLLRGVNDSAETMIALCAGLQRIRVRPYYVFSCDPVKGTSHFRVDAEKTREIARRVAESLGGLAVPKFVADIPGALFKQPV